MIGPPPRSPLFPYTTLFRSEVTAQGRCSVKLERLRTGAPAMMDGVFQQTIEAASASLAGGKSIRMPSGAGHDAQIHHGGGARSEEHTSELHSHLNILFPPLP